MALLSPQSSPSLMASHRSRTLTAAFHSFVADCCRLDAAQRPSATDHLITAHPFLRQHLKAKVGTGRDPLYQFQVKECLEHSAVSLPLFLQLSLSAILDQKQSPTAAARTVSSEIEGRLTLAADGGGGESEEAHCPAEAASAAVEWVF